LTSDRGCRAVSRTPPDEGFVRRVNRRGMRRGFTTGACAAAAARAAILALVRQAPVDQVTIPLPAGFDATFRLHRCEWGPDEAHCSIIKDAGDDPDVTHGAE